MPVATLPPQTLHMHTRDGVRLDADVYRPAAAGRYPVLLMRQAYGRRIASTVCLAHPSWYAAHGYIVVVQDIRGRGTSEGSFSPGMHDAQDGADTVAWAAQLPGSNGRVGMYGFSYQGYGQFMAASLAGPELQCIAPSMVPWDAREGWSHSQGAFRLQGTMHWAAQLAAEAARHNQQPEAYAELTQAYHALPLHETIPARPAVMERHRHLSHYAAWRDTPPGDAYWQHISAAAHQDAIAARRLPTLIVSGWYDCFLEGSLAAWHDLQGRSDAPVHLVVGPWLHFPWVRQHGGVDFGPEADGGIDQLHLRWFDHWLKDVDNGIAAQAPLRLFDMGSQQWQHLSAWPQKTHTFYLHATGLASMDATNGQLLPELPAHAPVADSVITDPWRPAPSFGGAHGTPAGAANRAGIDARGDVLTYTTAPLGNALALAGAVNVTLHVHSDRPSFDVACTLSRVLADGQVIPLAEGYRHLSSAEVAAGGASSHTPMPVHIALAATCATVQPGECLRLSIAGANFPAYALNPGTGEDPKTATGASALVTTLGVHYGADAPSQLTLHIA